jgi:mannitol 2-dehydrogenase
VLDGRSYATLQPVPKIDLDDYKQTLIERFANPKIQDRLPRLCLNSAAKIPKFILGSLRDALRQEGAIDYMSLAIVAWCRYLKGQDDQGNPIPIDDPMANILTQRARSGGSDPRALLSLFEIFGDLPHSSRFVETITNSLRSLDEFGVKEMLARQGLKEY